MSVTEVIVPPVQLTGEFEPGATGAAVKLNQKRRFLQVTVLGGSVGTVTFKLRPVLDELDKDDLENAVWPDDQFELITDLVIDLASADRQRTFTISDRYSSALKVIRSAGTGNIKLHIKQFND